ncbi:MAG TPA: hypothetical protein VFZ70_13990 [Euzebyales bacterium]
MWLDGATGEGYVGALAMSRPATSNVHLATLLQHADEQVDVTLFARATTEDQITDAVRRGADGIVTSVDDVFATSGPSTTPWPCSPTNWCSTVATCRLSRSSSPPSSRRCCAVPPTRR